MFFDEAKELYAGFCKKRSVIVVPEQYRAIAEQVVKKIGWKSAVVGMEHPAYTVNATPDDRVMVALSGVMDSVYLMHKLIDNGNKVVAVHVAGLNKNASKYEEESARRSAQKAGAKFIKIKFNAPAQAFPDNPFKNQLILSMMLDIGAKEGICRYAVGSDWTTPLSEAVTGFTITDSIEVNREYWQGVKAHFPNAELVFVPDNEKKYQRIKMLYRKGVLQYVSSCVSPHRFREYRHKQNVQKYGVWLMDGRCGSCYKCAMEYIMLVEAGYIEKNAAYYAHCWHTLATSETSHRPDLFAENIPLEQRITNLKNYGS